MLHPIQKYLRRKVFSRPNKMVDTKIDQEVEQDAGWHLDTHSTFLSRKHSYHKMVGKKRYVKIRRPELEGV